ncbi:tRNA (uridine(54)-C5)-methyltransferase TrmA [Glaciecola sp. MH2013]|uniref:tRNA (uridine(54)-C5)-methyltransferase TrmA n=1 Tax=Glaciecola sp. MH2013 TaxID=2785524 RepID=UPI00189EA6C0|nr:tRNA (uridine(54)-C5)-methyltransferase TrmA [Glaciecola sp. MH2013]MBF7074964.1 tRNA (uridine(54)-C5)-methyltransferase TrmA [Glaciecola sp. MH2013]
MALELTQAYAEQLQDKEKKIKDLLSPFYTLAIDSYPSKPENFRMRAEFRIWHEGSDSYHIMFDQNSKQQYRVDYLPAASLLINKAMTAVCNALVGNEVLRKKLFQIDYLSTLTDEILVTMVYHRPLDDEWLEEIAKLQQGLAPEMKVEFIGRSKKQKLVPDRDYVIERLPIFDKHYEFKQIENSFTQPNALVNCKMIEWAMTQTKQSDGDLLELYCGAGNFSIPMASIFDKVLATEISKTSVNAAQFNIDRNAISNLKIVRFSSEEFVEAMKGERKFVRLKDIELNDYAFSTVLVDPPRAGLDSETIKLIQQFDNIIYISCNPVTLADNLTTLTTTHEVKRAAIFDQFPFTSHIESGVFLSRR